MSRYYSCNDFMSDVLVRTDEICRIRHGSSLREYANASETVMEAIRNEVFSGLISWSVPTFFAPPPMPIVLFAGVVGGVIRSKKSRQRKPDEMLIEAVRKMGARFKGRWEALDGYKSGIDALVDEAADYLLGEVRS